jgi:hypothetical protein
MPSDLSLEDRHARVLVVYVHPAVGAALARRLMDLAEVTLAGVANGLAVLQGPTPPDVLVLCAYLLDNERVALRQARNQCIARPALIEITDLPGAARAHLRSPGTARDLPFLSSILSALTLENG